MRTDPRETAETSVPRRPLFPAPRRARADVGGASTRVSLFEFENLVAIGIVLLFGAIVLASGGATTTPGTPADGEAVVIDAPPLEAPPLNAPAAAPASGITLATAAGEPSAESIAVEP